LRMHPDLVQYVCSHEHSTMLLFFSVAVFTVAACSTSPALSLLLLTAGVGGLIVDHFI